MPQTLAILLPVLTFLAAPAGAGYGASLLFAQLRRILPCPTPGSNPARVTSNNPIAHLTARIVLLR